MRRTKWILTFAAGVFLLTSNFALAQDHGNGHGKGHDKHGDDDDRDEYRDEHRGDHEEHLYGDRDHEAMRGWYDDHRDRLPPGLAKRDQLPPGLEKQLVRRGTLPPGLQKRIQPCPEELERRLAPPPPECAHVLVGGHLVLLNRRTNVIVDVVHFEIR
jgi:Ni/Co efflux regulator RcnB